MTASGSDISVFRVADLPQRKPTRFTLAPAQSDLDALAQELNLSDLRKLRFEGQLSGVGKTDWKLTAKLGATVVQPCVVSLKPVTTRIETTVERLFTTHLEESDTEGEFEMTEDENTEALGAEIDIALVMRESLALNLPLYPRADEASLEETVFTEPGKQAMTDEDARPFAGLASLRDKLAGGEND